MQTKFRNLKNLMWPHQSSFNCIARQGRRKGFEFGYWEVVIFIVDLMLPLDRMEYDLIKFITPSMQWIMSSRDEPKKRSYIHPRNLVWVTFLLLFLRHTQMHALHHKLEKVAETGIVVVHSYASVPPPFQCHELSSIYKRPQFSSRAKTETVTMQGKQCMTWLACRLRPPIILYDICQWLVRIRVTRCWKESDCTCTPLENLIIFRPNGRNRSQFISSLIFCFVCLSQTRLNWSPETGLSLHLSSTHNSPPPVHSSFDWIRLFLLILVLTLPCYFIFLIELKIYFIGKPMWCSPRRAVSQK